MIAVIQCAARKQPDAGRLVSRDGTPVVFVAYPLSAPADDRVVYARPDDPYDDSTSWREVLLRYNEHSSANPLGLLPACRLYENKTYARLVARFGVRDVYILSAGWGLIRSDFLTPYYDITFSPSADGYKKRKRSDRYQDFCMVPTDTDKDIVFFGGKDYLPLFAHLTRATGTRKVVFYNSSRIPEANGLTPVRFETTTRTNWHYECANAFLDGSIGLSGVT